MSDLKAKTTADSYDFLVQQKETASPYKIRGKLRSMASQFSGALQLTDLDDFITPSQVIHDMRWFHEKFTTLFSM